MANPTIKTKKVHSKKWHVAWRSIICVFDAALALTGLILIILGIISDYLPKKNSENWTGNANFEAATGLDYRWFGFILIACAIAIMFVAFNIIAHRDASDKERELRRQERMKVLAASENTSLEQNASKDQALEVSAQAK